MLPDLKYVERRLSAELGQRILVHCATREVDPLLLTPAERRRLDELHNPSRRRDWLVGRSALKRLLGRMGLSQDTSELQLPHPRVSLTHNHGMAVAVGVLDPDGAGVGVDLQVGRWPRAEALRFFLRDDERHYVFARGHRGGEDALRLWTVKEAVLKADPLNRGRILFDYCLRAPGRWVGTAACRGLEAFRYSSLAVESGFLTVAVNQEDAA